MGSCKVIEYNIQMESFRLYKIKESRLDVTRGSICNWNDKLLIIGGLQESETLDDVIIYQNGSFTHSMFKLNISRYYHVSCTVGNHIYIIGGLDSKFRATASVELLLMDDLENKKSNKMQKSVMVNPMHQGRHNFAI